MSLTLATMIGEQSMSGLRSMLLPCLFMERANCGRSVDADILMDFVTGDIVLQVVDLNTKIETKHVLVSEKERMDGSYCGVVVQRIREKLAS